MMDRITRSVEHLQREDHVQDDQHQYDLDNLEQEFHANNYGPSRNIHMSVHPAEMCSCCQAPYMWKQEHSTSTARDKQDARSTQSAAGNCRSLWDKAWQDAADCKRKFEADVQFIFSHVQHHWHQKEEQGKRVPLKYCRIKGRKGKHLCKGGFPKKVLRHKRAS